MSCVPKRDQSSSFRVACHRRLFQNNDDTRGKERFERHAKNGAERSGGKGPLLDNQLIPKSADPEAKVFYMRMKGDFHRYLAEIKPTEADDLRTALKAYQEAYSIAREKLRPSHPIRLGVALNFSVFYEELLKSTEEARRIAQKVGLRRCKGGVLTDSSDDKTLMEARAILKKLKVNLAEWNQKAGRFDDMVKAVKKGSHRPCSVSKDGYDDLQRHNGENS
ncbi:hypothetical protein niasHT_021220 [Heterodera trifolii]|uniref:14-3-3 domain-containing protein n=1 Tax=Heterodera trifolii TaxID=157864 RepID=A0ABD2JWD7_9BILA